MKPVLISLSLATPVIIATYWILVFTGITQIQDFVPGYVSWFMAYRIPDLWIAGSGLLAGILLSRNSVRAVPFGIASGSALVFLAVQELTYLVDTGLASFQVSVVAEDILFGAVGTFLMIRFWKIREVLE